MSESNIFEDDEVIPTIPGTNQPIEEEIGDEVEEDDDEEVEDEDGEEDWMRPSEPNAAYEAAVNPLARFRIQSTTTSKDVPTERDYDAETGIYGEYKAEPLHAILSRAGLTFGAGTVFQLDGANIGYDQVVQPGATIVAIGNVKGGNA